MIRIIFDTETTGLIKNPAKPLSSQPYIIEVGAIKVDENFNEIDRLGYLIRPPIQLPGIITTITGIRDGDLELVMDFAASFHRLADFFRGADEFIAHNLPFDRNMLLFELQRMGMEYHFPWPTFHTCTVQASKSLFGGKYMKLENLYKHAFHKDPHQTHRAVEDCELLLDVCRWLKGEGVL